MKNREQHWLYRELECGEIMMDWCSRCVAWYSETSRDAMYFE